MKLQYYRDVIVYEKLRFQNVFHAHTKAGKFLCFAEHSRKAAFLWRISVDGWPKCRKKAAFSNFAGDVWTGPQMT